MSNCRLVWSLCRASRRHSPRICENCTAGYFQLLIVIAAVVGCLAHLAFVVAAQRIDAVTGSTFRWLEIRVALGAFSLVLNAAEPHAFELFLGAGCILLGSAWLTLYSLPLSRNRRARRVSTQSTWSEPTIDALR